MRQLRIRLGLRIGMLAGMVIGTTALSSALLAPKAIAAGAPSVAYVPTPIDDIFVVIPVGVNLPLDPGTAGDTTIQGIDANGNGVRDDIEREIFLPMICQTYASFVAVFQTNARNINP